MKSKDLEAFRTKSSVYTDKRLPWIFYGAWFLINMVQACFTQLQDDEAYYWVYSQFLSWGYFDHPPMIAALVRSGSAILPAEAGVRLLPVILNVLTVIVTEKLIGKKDTALFFAVCLSAAALQLTGFWAVPDVPLVFFTALFFLCYRNFIELPSRRTTLLLGLVAAGLLYSKYHGALVILFVILADLKVLRNYRIYLAGFLALLAFLPHLYWQYQNDWMTFYFQLFENKAKPYRLFFTMDYVFGQLLVAGPIAGVIILYGSLAYKPQSRFERILKFHAIGFFVFFFLSTFRGQVEANWTAPALIPMLVLTHNFLKAHLKWKLWLYRLLPVTVVLVILARIVMIWDLVPVPAIVERFHSWKKWPAELAMRTDHSFVVFNNSYQRASMYWFYTGVPAYSLNSYEQRRNNYNYWPVEDSLLGKKVYRMDIYNVSSYKDSIQATLWKIGYTPDSNFHSFTKIILEPTRPKYTVTSGNVIISFKTFFPAHYKNYLLQHPELNAPVRLVVYQKKKLVCVFNCSFSLRDLLMRPDRSCSFLPGLNKGEYQFLFAIGAGKGLYTYNGMKTKLTIR